MASPETTRPSEWKKPVTGRAKVTLSTQKADNTLSVIGF